MNHSETSKVGNPAWHIRSLTESARQLAKSGNFADAEKIYEQILDAAPYHIRSLNFLGTRAMERGDSTRARSLYERALKVDAKRPGIHQNLGILLLAENDFEGALHAFETATSLRDNFIYSWIYQGDIHKQMGRRDSALSAYSHAIKLLPSVEVALADTKIPAAKRLLIKNAAISLYTMKHGLFLEALSDVIDKYGEATLKRVLDCAKIKAGLEAPIYSHALQRPDWMYMPGIDSQPFFETDNFRWIEELEAKSSEIRSELKTVLGRADAFNAYVDINDKDAQQWTALNHSKAWSSYHLYRGGEPLQDNCKQCPVTSQALSKLPLLKIPGHASEAFFSVLQPGTHIPPHYGLSNYKLAVHLPLIVPDDCAIRVGYETRTWTEDKCMIFDDSFQHEAWNNSSNIRAVLIFEVWNPELTAAEQNGISALAKAAGEFYSEYGL
jgi:tetratricopeptide (TPR) repeat protein